jgi:H+/Cl- antiporter ClcA
MYAVVAAAAVLGAQTKTVSIVIILYEVTGCVSLMMPMMICMLVAILASNGMTMGIYDIVIEFKNFPYMPTLG